MKQLTFEMVGTYAYLMNAPTKMEHRGAAGDKVKTATKAETPEEEAEGRCYRLPSGQLYAPGMSAHASLIDACVGRKLSGNKAARAVFGSNVFVEDEVLPFYDPETLEPVTKYEVDLRRVVNAGRNAGSVMRARPKIPRWACRVTFSYDETQLSPETILEVFQIAGARVGWGDFRPKPGGPGNPGPFGRYAVRLVG